MYHNSDYTVVYVGHWSYENIKTWTNDNPYCGGHLQSPIDLRFNISHIDRRLKQIYLKELYSRGK